LGNAVVRTEAATLVTMWVAALNGNLVSLQDLADVWFEHGLTTAYRATTPAGVVSLNAPGVFRCGVTGLLADTTYHFRAATRHGGSGTWRYFYRDDRKFTTGAPAVIGNASTGITDRGATLNGAVTFTPVRRCPGRTGR